MKIWFLVIYLFHGHNIFEFGHWAYGGPSLSIVRADSKDQCEKLGSKIKAAMDHPTKLDKMPALVWCIDVEGKKEENLDIESRKRLIRENQKYLDDLKRKLNE